MGEIFCPEWLFHIVILLDTLEYSKQSSSTYLVVLCLGKLNKTYFTYLLLLERELRHKKCNSQTNLALFLINLKFSDIKDDFDYKNSIMQIRKFRYNLYQKLLCNSFELKFVLSKEIDNSVTFISREKNNLFSYLWSCHIRNGTMGLDCFELVQTPIQLFQSFDRQPNVVIIWKEKKNQKY